MTTAHNKIIAKFQMLDEYAGYLTELQNVNKNFFVSDYRFFWFGGALSAFIH